MSKQKQEDTIEVILGQQYGSDIDHAGRGRIDPRRFTNINEAEAFCIAYFMNTHDYHGGQWVKKYIENYLNLKMGVNGWRANQGIRVIAGSKGAPTVDVAKRPGWFSRNVTKRNWKEKAEQEGVEVIE